MFLSVDIGGTSTRVAVSPDGKKISKLIKYPTPPKYDDGLDLLQDTIEEISNNNLPKLIVVGIAGFLDLEKGKIIQAPAANLRKWSGHSIRQELAHRLHTRVEIANDATLGGLGEAHFKGRKKYNSLAYITLSTGVGGVKIFKGRIDDHHDILSEPGHQILDPGGRYWPGCGQKGCFEALCSGAAFEIEYGVKPEYCEDTKIWEEHARVCAQGLVNTIVMWTPDILVIGGSLVKAGRKFTDPLMHFTSSDLKIFPAPKIEISKMGDENGLLGGMAYATLKFS